MPKLMSLKVAKDRIKPIDESSSIGEQIKYYRCMAGLRQDELANKIGFERGMISKYENKEIKLLNVKAFKAIMQELDIEDKMIVHDDYISFMFNNPIQQLLDFKIKNNIESTDLSKLIDTDISVIKRWERGQSQMTRASYNKLKKCMD